VTSRRDKNCFPRPARHGWAATALLAALVAIIALWPLAYAAWRIVQGLARDGIRVVHAEDRTLEGLHLPLAVSTLASAILIGLLATLLAWPAAWWVRRLAGRGPGVLAILCVPLLLPASLAYSGWGLARAPGTLLGDSIERAAGQGWTDLPIIVGKILAFGGLSLWASGIAILILVPAVRRVDAALIDAIDLEAVGPRGTLARESLKIRWCAGSIATSIAIVSLVMIGSPVPLHLAQIDTYATRVWLALDRTPQAQQWAAWLAAWPIIIAATVGAWWASRVMTEVAEDSSPGPSSREERRGTLRVGILSLLTWSCAIIVPIALFAFSVRNATSYATVLRVNADAIARSLAAALGVALVLMLVCALTWAAASCSPAASSSHTPRRRTPTLARTLVRLLVVVGLCPGVLVGSWVASAWSGLPVIADSPVMVVLAHAARFAFITGLIGLRLAAMESPAQRDARLLDGGVGLIGWARSLGWTASIPLAGVAVIVALLSLNEIEASIMVVPPGFDTLARRVLDYLHFARLEELSALSVMLGGAGFALAGLAMRLLKK